MTEKRFHMIIEDVEGNFYYLDKVTNEKITSTLKLEDKLNELADENEQLRKENEKLEALWEDKCIKEYMGIVGEYALQEMHKEKYGDKE